MGRTITSLGTSGRRLNRTTDARIMYWKRILGTIIYCHTFRTREYAVRVELQHMDSIGRKKKAI